MLQASRAEPLHCYPSEHTKCVVVILCSSMIECRNRSLDAPSVHLIGGNPIKSYAFCSPTMPVRNAPLYFVCRGKLGILPCGELAESTGRRHPVRRQRVVSYENGKAMVDHGAGVHVGRNAVRNVLLCSVQNWCIAVWSTPRCIRLQTVMAVDVNNMDATG